MPNQFTGSCPAIERFWSKVEKTEGCWLWTGGRDKDGYGKFWYDGATRRAHGVIWTLTHSSPIPEGLCVLHRCDNPPCVKPDHLWVGTNADNAADRTHKGRGSKKPAPVFHGEEHGMAKITEVQVREIRARYTPNVVSYGMLAKEYGVTRRQIINVVKRISWGHIS